MGKPVVGEVVVLPFPQTNLQSGKRRPALVVADVAGDDVILSQITSRSRSDSYSIPLGAGDFERGQLAVESYVRANRLFTVDQAVIAYSAGKVSRAKIEEIRTKIRQLFT